MAAALSHDTLAVGTHTNQKKNLHIITSSYNAVQRSIHKQLNCTLVCEDTG